LLSDLPEAEEVEVIVSAEGDTEMVPVVERASEILTDSEQAFNEEVQPITADSFLAAGWNDDGSGGFQPLAIVPSRSFIDTDFLESVKPSLEADSDDYTIQALAQELEYDPVLIQKWVQENIFYTPYFKSLQGASGCLSSKQCNDTDTAHLLVALFRASEIPARYHEQRLSIPFDIYRNMLGAESNEIALNIAKEFESGKDPKAVLQNGNEVSLESVSDANSVESIALNTVWAEAYVPYAAEQSATGIITPAGVEGISELTTNAEVLSALDDGQRRLWIPFSLLGAERVLENTPQFAPQNHASRLSDFVLEFLSTPTKKSPSEILDGIFGITEANQSSYLPTFTQSAADTGGLLPTTLPGIASGDAFLSPTLDHHSGTELKIRLTNESGSEVFADAEDIFSLDASSNIEIRFSGATTTDDSAIETKGSIYNLTPAELETVQIVPALFVDGEETSRGTVPVPVNEVLNIGVSLEKGLGMSLEVLAKEDGVILAGADTGVAFFTGAPEFLPEYHLSQGLPDLAKHLLYRESEEKGYLAELFHKRFFPHTGVAFAAVNQYSKQSAGSDLGPDVAGYKAGSTVSGNIIPYTSEGIADEGITLNILNSLAGMSLEESVLEDKSAMPALSALRVLRNASTGDENNTVSLVSVSDTEDPVLQNTELPTAMKEAVETLLGAGYKVYLPSGTVVIDGEGYLAYVGAKEDTGKVAGGVFGADGGVTAQGGVTISGIDVLRDYDLTKTACPMGGWQVCEFSDDRFARAFDDNPQEGSPNPNYFSVFIENEDHRKKTGALLKSKMVEYQNDYVLTNNNQCHVAGAPIADEETYTFGDYSHSFFWEWSNGGRFNDEIPVTNDHIFGQINEVADNYQNGEKYGEIKYSSTLGTYRQEFCTHESFEILTDCDPDDVGSIYYSPSDMIAYLVKGDFLKKLTQDRYGIDVYVAKELGFPIGHESIAASFPQTGSKGYYQEFINGNIYKETTGRNKTYYIPGKINECHDNPTICGYPQGTSGGTDGEFGFPTSDPEKGDCPESISGECDYQSFDNKDQIILKPNGTTEAISQRKYRCEVYGNAPAWKLPYYKAHGFIDGLYFDNVKNVQNLSLTLQETVGDVKNVILNPIDSLVSLKNEVKDIVIALINIDKQKVWNAISGVATQAVQNAWDEVQAYHACPARQNYVDGKFYGMAVSTILVYGAVTKAEGASETVGKQAETVLENLQKGNLLPVNLRITQLIKRYMPGLLGKYKVVARENIGDEIKTFKGKEYYTVETLEEVTVYRVYDTTGKAPIERRFATTDDITTLNRSEIRQKLALSVEFNDAEYIAKITIPTGSKINVGLAGPLEHKTEGVFKGGGSQVFISNSIQSEWVTQSQIPILD
jgi:hypothetical protein